MQWKCKECGKIFNEPDAHQCCGVFKEDTKFEQIEEQKVIEQYVIPWKYGNRALESGVYLVCSKPDKYVKMDIANLDGHFMSADSEIYAYVELKDIPKPVWEQTFMQE